MGLDRPILFPMYLDEWEKYPYQGCDGLTLEDGPFHHVEDYGSQVSHKESRPHMLYDLESMASTVFNLSEEFLVTFKKQLTKCPCGELQ